MNGLGVLCTGATGSGKTRMVARHATPWRRVIIADPTGSVGVGEPVLTWDEAVEKVGTLWPAPAMSLRLVFGSDSDWARCWAGLAALAEVQRRAFWVERQPMRPTLLVLDEVDTWSSPNAIDPNLSKLLRYGRHAGMSWAATCRADVETHRDIRGNAAQLVVFQQGMLSPDTRRALAAVGVDLDPLTLERHTGAGSAEEGRHFVCTPQPWGDWWARWAGMARPHVIRPPDREGA